jgi:hypothetical protein
VAVSAAAICGPAAAYIIMYRRAAGAAAIMGPVITY